MSDLSQQAGQSALDSVNAEIRQHTQDLSTAETVEDEAKTAFLRKRLEQLGEEKLIILRAQNTGLLCLLLSSHASCMMSSS